MVRVGCGENICNLFTDEHLCPVLLKLEYALKSPEDLMQTQALIQQLGGGAGDPAFLRSSPRMLFVLEPHFE